MPHLKPLVKTRPVLSDQIKMLASASFANPLGAWKFTGIGSDRSSGFKVNTSRRCDKTPRNKERDLRTERWMDAQCRQRRRQQASDAHGVWSPCDQDWGGACRSWRGGDRHSPLERESSEDVGQETMRQHAPLRMSQEPR